MASREPVTIQASSGLSAVIDPHGAQLVSLKTAGGTELIWQGDPRSWPDHAPILFPLISQMPGGHIHHRGCDYPMPPHGFAHIMDFSLSRKTESSCTFELRDDEETHTHYPFSFGLDVGFDLSDDGLLVTITVENPNDEPMPADVGFHPGFNWPLTGGLSKDEYVIVFDKDESARSAAAETTLCCCTRMASRRLSMGTFCARATRCSKGRPSCSTGSIAGR
jgi:galactose mutarotase-like enzyme